MRMPTLVSIQVVLLFMTLGGCRTPGAGQTHPSDASVDFEGLRFQLGSCSVDGSGDSRLISCDLTYQSLHEKPLEVLFFPRFTLVDAKGREFQPKPSSDYASEPLNPGLTRAASVQFEVPADAVGQSDAAPRLRVMCPMVARAGFMMQEAKLQGYYFYFHLQPPSPAALSSAPSLGTTSGAALAPLVAGADQGKAQSGIRNGMSRQQVFDTWGKPLNQMDSGSLSIWSYKRGDSTISLQFQSDRLTDFHEPFAPTLGAASGTAKSAALRNGMGWSEVYELWGKPVTSIYTGTTSIWGYKRDSGIVTLQFNSGCLVDYVPPFVPDRK